MPENLLEDIFDEPVEPTPVEKFPAEDVQKTLDEMEAKVKSDELMRDKLVSVQPEVIDVVEPTLEPIEDEIPTTLHAFFFGDLFCPKCYVKLVGYSPTGPRPTHFTHPWAESPINREFNCPFKGRKFKPPVVPLEILPIDE